MRKLIHIDMDAFFAAIEIRENPTLKGKPVIVGGHPHSRGVVSTCNYEARKYGIHSGMSSAQAWKLCPHAIFIRPNFQLYKEASEIIKNIFFSKTDKVECMSLDEAYIDVTDRVDTFEQAVVIAKDIKEQIYYKTKLTASAGVSFNKFLAKIGSDLQKPNGLVLIPPEKAQEILFSLPIDKFHGIGKVTSARMKKLGILNGKDLFNCELKELIKHFGKIGIFYYEVVRGIDNREVVTYSEPKTISCETTLEIDINSLQDVLDVLGELANKLSIRMKKKDLSGKLFFLKIKYDNFETITRSQKLSYMTNDRDSIYETAISTLVNSWNGIRKIRLLGIGIGKLDKYDDDKSEQLILPFV